LYWYTLITARRIRSDMLKANAWHHRSDAISSVVVLAGVAGAMLGWSYLDSVAAVLVGFMIGRIAWDLGKEAMEELVDTALDEESVERARQVIMRIDGVRSLHLLRTRRHGHEATADVHVQVAPRLSVSEGHMISQAVEDRLIEALDALTDVTVHIDPEDDEQAPPSRDLPLRNAVIDRLGAYWEGVGLPPGCEIGLHYLSGRIDIDIVLPAALEMPKGEAEGLRRRLAERVAGDADIGRLRLLFTVL
jgi:hypothetical protein